MSNANSNVWLVDLQTVSDELHAIEAATPRLSPDECARIDQVADPEVKRFRRATYIAQRLVLEHQFGRSIRRQSLPRDRTGRPRLPPGHSGSTSLSHAGTHALIATSLASRVGVDLETPRPIRMSQSRRNLIVAAAATLSPWPLPVDETARFLQAWTRLEALAKAGGNGIGHLLTAIGAVGGNPKSPPAAATLAASHGLTIHDLSVGPTQFAAIATPDKEKPALHLWPAGLSAL